MTDGLGFEDVYGATLDRIKGQGGERARLGMATLIWISHAERPLKADELRHALAVEIGSPSLNTDNLPSIGTLLACCQGLVVVEKETFTVRLIHFTLQEYLRARPGLFGTAHSTMAETCLSYLNSRQIMALPPVSFPHLQDTPFLEYSSVYWGVHAKKDLSDCAKLLALKLFDDYSNHVSVKILLRAQKSWYFSGIYSENPYLFSSLHCASLFGIGEITAKLVEVESCDINKIDDTGNTPLFWAAWNGHKGVVKILLGRDDVDPNKSVKCGQTPLGCAARNGHEGVVKILLTRDDVDPDKPDEQGITPLGWAVEGGHEGVVKILLAWGDLNPDRPHNYGLTLLGMAAWRGHEGVVKILLGRDDVDPDKPNKNGRTPLSLAAGKGRERVVEILLERGDVNPDKPDDKGRTPLWWATSEGCEGVVKMLLGQDGVNPIKRRKFG